MHLEGKLPAHILFLPEGETFFEVGVKAHKGAGLRDVLVPRVQAFGEHIDYILGQDLSAEEIVLAAFSVDETSSATYIPQRGVRLEVHIPGEGLLLVKSDTISEVAGKIR